jgi:hypothetical protein
MTALRVSYTPAVNSRSSLRSNLLLARNLSRSSPTTAAGLDPAHFNYGGALTQGPNCYSYAMGDASQRLTPGWLAHCRGDARATGAGGDPVEQREMFILDGLIPLTGSALPVLPAGSWIVTLHQRDNGDFHLRRLDATGWSEKRGDHPVRRFKPMHWSGLLRARSEQGRYDFAGFFLVSP